jgi:hypothetical protein
MTNKRERITEIKCILTPSHQSDLLDTLMCKFRLLPGKKDIVYGDTYVGDYNRDYKEQNPLINSFNLDIKNFLEQGGRISTMKHKTLFEFPYTTINKGDPKNVVFGHFPSFVCEFKETDKGVDIKCYHDYMNTYEDFKDYKKEFPESAEYL